MFESIPLQRRVADQSADVYAGEVVYAGSEAEAAHDREPVAIFTGNNTLGVRYSSGVWAGTGDRIEGARKFVFATPWALMSTRRHRRCCRESPASATDWRAAFSCATGSLSAAAAIGGGTTGASAPSVSGRP